MADTAEILRAALRQSRPKRSGDGYPPELRDRVGRWAMAQEAAGTKLTQLALQLGISTTSVRSWSRAAGGVSAPSAGQFLPVTVKPDVPLRREAGEVLLHTPHGYRVSGLGLDQLIAVLRGLE